MGRKLAENVLYERGLSVFVCVCVVVFASMCVCVRLRVIDESNEQLEYGSEQWNRDCIDHIWFYFHLTQLIVNLTFPIWTDYGPCFCSEIPVLKVIVLPVYPFRCASFPFMAYFCLWSSNRAINTQTTVLCMFNEPHICKLTYISISVSNIWASNAFPTLYNEQCFTHLCIFYNSPESVPAPQTLG